MRYYRVNSPQQFLKAAARAAPLRYRWLGKSLSTQELDARLGLWNDWLQVKATLADGDRIWPFVLRENTLAMREGYVFIRDRQPFGCLVVVSS